MAFTTYELSEPQVVAILAAIKQLQPEQVAAFSDETKDNLSLAYHRLRGRLTASLHGSAGYYAALDNA